MHHGRTNVLWITICTLRADHLGAYGYEHPVSPFIDSLAERGVLFERVVSAAPWTRPSMASAITGLYPRSLNIELPNDGSRNRRIDDSFDTLAEVLAENGYHTIGITANPNAGSAFNFDQGYDHFEGPEEHLWRESEVRKQTAEQVNTSLLKHLRGPGKGKKFFAHLIYVDVHWPLTPEAAAHRFADLRKQLGYASGANYDLMIRSVDAAIEDLLKQLRKMGYDDTLVIIHSDHGEVLEFHRGETAAHGEFLYNDTIWVPLIFQHPSMTDWVHRIPDRVESVCVAPTILELLGIDRDEPENGGWSLAGRMRGQGGRLPNFSVVETAYEDSVCSAILMKGWKLIAAYPNGEDAARNTDAVEFELYRHRVDRDEQWDRAADNPDEVRRLSGLLKSWQSAHPPLVPNETNQTEIDEKTVEQLKALGYKQ